MEDTQQINKRKLVTIRAIDGLEPIDGADAIEVAVIEGWKCVVKKNEFTVGQPCVYIECDAFLPDGVPAWQFLVDKSPRTFEGTVGHRLRTIKLRKQISQGLVLPLSTFPEIMALMTIPWKAEVETSDKEFPLTAKEAFAKAVCDAVKVGVESLRDQDFSELLGIKKFEQPLPAALQGQAEGLFPSFIQKTDQERCQNLVREIFEYHETQAIIGDWLDIQVTQPADGQLILGKATIGEVDSPSTFEEVWDQRSQLGLMTHWKPIITRPAKADPEALYEVTMKLDGSSMTAFVRGTRDTVPEGSEGNVAEVGVCSRNLQLKISDANKDNTFVRVLMDTCLNVALKAFYESTGREIAVQGEVMAPGIQGNRENFSAPKFFVFDIYDIQAREYLNPVQRMEVFEMLKELAPTINHVPVLHSDVKLRELNLKSVQDLIAFAKGPSMVHKVREGVVFKRLDGQFSFKAINNDFLLKESD